MTTTFRESYSTKYFIMHKDKTDPMYYYCDAVRRGIDAAEAIIDEPTHTFCNALIRALKMGPHGPNDFDTQLQHLVYQDILHFAACGAENAAKMEIMIEKPTEDKQNDGYYSYVVIDPQFFKEGELRTLILNKITIDSFVSRFSRKSVEAMKQILKQNLIEEESDEPQAKKRRRTQKGQVTRLQNKLDGFFAHHGGKVEERVEIDMICFIAIKILHGFSLLFNYSNPACRALLVMRNNKPAILAKKLDVSDTRMFLNLGNVVEELFFGGIVHVEDCCEPIATELACRKESSVHHNSLMLFHTEAVSGSLGKFFPFALASAISQGTYDGNILPYQDEINSSEGFCCVAPRFKGRNSKARRGRHSKTFSDITAGANKFREYEQSATDPEAKAYFKEQADWYDSLTIEEKLQYHTVRF